MYVLEKEKTKPEEYVLPSVSDKLRGCEETSGLSYYFSSASILPQSLLVG